MTDTPNDTQRLSKRMAQLGLCSRREADHYIEQGCVPGGTLRNFDSYASKVSPVQELHKRVLCDPQTSGGLLVAVSPQGNAAFLAMAADNGLALEPIGQLVERQTYAVEVS